MVDATSTRFAGRDEVRRHHETGFALMPAKPRAITAYA